MDNGTVPSDVQPPVPVSPAVTSVGEPGTPDPVPEAPLPAMATGNGAGPNPAMSQAASFEDAATKLRQGIAKAPLLSVGIAALAGLTAALLIPRPKSSRRLKF